jgi:hypothetical protein
MNLLYDSYWSAKVGVCGQGYIADASHPDIVNWELIFFGLTGNMLLVWN